MNLNEKFCNLGILNNLVNSPTKSVKLLQVLYSNIKL